MTRPSKEILALLRSIAHQGWAVERTASGHFRCRPPRGGPVIHIATSSDPRGIKNARAQLRRFGAKVNP